MKTITPEMSQRYYERRGAMNGESADGPDVTPCFYCDDVEDYGPDEQCPCLPVEPPVEEYDVRWDR